VKTITFKASATKEWAKLPQAIKKRLGAKLERYAETGEGDVTRLVGQPYARLRVGDYRIIFAETETAIDVRAVGNRREIYR
jgi:mRNA interferase RelE/StbE